MSVVIWGAGAIGGVLGAWLARSGREVLLVDRDEDHVRAIRAGGLVITGTRGTLTVRPRGRGVRCWARLLPSSRCNTRSGSGTADQSGCRGEACLARDRCQLECRCLTCGIGSSRAGQGRSGTKLALDRS
jgi:hypothetical protein